MIYKDYLEGKGANGIARELEEKGIKGWNGKVKWYESTIRGILTNEKYKGDALLQNTYTVDFLTKKKKMNEGEVPKYYVEDSHPAIVDKDAWESVQLEIERRRAFAEEHGTVKLDYATLDKPFAGRVICGKCGGIFGRKTWKACSENRKKVWICKSKYIEKGVKGCDNKHIYDIDLSKIFINVFNTMVENRDYFMEKWRDELGSENPLHRYKVRQLMKAVEEGELLHEFDAELFLMIIECFIVYKGKNVIVRFADGSEIEAVIK